MEQKISYVVDTNIFLEFLLKQERREESLKLMRKVERGMLEAYVTSFSLHSIEVTVERLGDMQRLEKFLDWVIHTKGLQVYHTSTEEEKHIASVTEKLKLDFDDALQYCVANTLQATLISFDRDFDKTDLKRIEPSDLV